MKLFYCLPLTAMLVLHAGCSQGTTEQPAEVVAAVAAPPDALVMVKDVAITDHDVQLVLKSGGHDEEELTPERRKNVLDVIVNKELRAQAATELGLANNASYLARIRPLEAQLNAVRRQALNDLYFRKEIEAKATVSDAEVKAYFEANKERIQTETHVAQILIKNRKVIEQRHREIVDGASFDEVAKKQFPGELPAKVARPWDMGFLKWSQLPAQWVPVLDGMKDGEVSGVIEGAGGRYWIVQKIESRKAPEIDLKLVRPIVTGLLKNERVEALQASTDKRLREEAGLD